MIHYNNLPSASLNELQDVFGFLDRAGCRWIGSGWTSRLRLFIILILLLISIQIAVFMSFSTNEK